MIETKRLIIRTIEKTETNLNALYILLSDEDVNRYLPWYPVKDRDETKQFYETQIESNYKKKVVIILSFVLKKIRIQLAIL